MTTQKRPKRSGLVSIGYGGRRLTALVDLLIQEHVEVLLDVRLRAVSAIPGFSGRTLERALAEVGINYRHEPPLGNPQENRAAFHEGPVELGRATFRELLRVGAARKAVEDLAGLVTGQRVAVLCAERDQERCHRHVIIEQVQELSPGLAVTVLS